MAASPSLMEPSSEADKLSYEIFTILETKFLFGYHEPKLFLPESSPEIPSKKPSGERASSPGKVCILSIDASNDCLLAAASLAHLESSLQRLSGDPAGRIADFFDIAAGSGTGGVLAALLFTRGPDGRPISADDALCFLLKTGALCDSAGERKGFFRRMFRRSGSSNFRKVFGKLTLRDTMKPVLIPCYDLTTGAPFLFSRADAVEADTYDFLIKEVCAATCAGRVASEMKSVDSRARIAAVGGGLAMPNPAAAAITHVLHNKQEFPFAAGVDDLILVSLGSGEQDTAVGCASPSTDEVVRIAANGMADVVSPASANQMVFMDLITLSVSSLCACPFYRKYFVVYLNSAGKKILYSDEDWVQI
ncbi:patatin-like protein 3 [Phalaenopsis equestris]|uniref:patatin-like protein 3 n=1 Tax=Phalaenopsis equestris TaxID=78828 RepID=UPI0009E37D53|nr:patatin-like protein 3 [Phalaenopsis equestris]